MSLRWERLDECELAHPGRWRLVPALATVKALPGLLQLVLGKRLVLVSLSDGRRLLAIRLPRGVVSCGEKTFVAEQVGYSKAWIVALDDSLQGQPEPTLPALPPGPVRLQLGERDWPELFWREFRLGCAVHALSRDWAWAWPRTCGPVILRVFFDGRPRAAIESWIHGLPPIFDDQGTLWEKHSQTGLFHSRFWDDARISMADNYLVWMRGYRHPTAEQVHYDHVALGRLANGELGELSFDLFDGDYFRYVASGFSSESFRRYLGARAKAGSSHPWNRFRLVPPIDARATSEGTCARLIGEALGWPDLEMESLCSRLKDHPLQEMPRHIDVAILESAFPEASRSRIVSAQPRIQWWWTLSVELPPTVPDGGG
jgi:hypothetical protein